MREIEHASWDLFASIGFDRATITEISKRAGVSRRTFFRYFRSKEELLSFSVEHFGERIAQCFTEAPLSKHPLRALEHAILSVLQEEMKDMRQPKELLVLMLEKPDLRGRFLCALYGWVPALGNELKRRRAYRGDAGRCSLTAAVYCTLFDQAHMRWFREAGSDLQTQMKRAFRQLRQAEQTGRNA